MFPDRAVVFSILLHIALLGATAINMDWQRPRQAGVTAVSIKATVVDSREMDRQRQEVEQELRREQEERDREVREQREAEAEAERERVREEQELQRQKEAAEAAELKRIDDERKRVEREAVEAEIKRKEEKLRLELAAKTAAEEAAKEAERVRKAEVERQRKEQADRERKAEEERVALVRRREAERQTQRENELQAMLTAESQRRTAVDSGLLDEYVALIQQKIRRNWNRPPSANDDMECWVSVQQIPGGEVVAVDMLDCNVAPPVWRSIEAAVLKASPLPEPPDPSLFERNLEILFVPTE